MKLLYSGHLIRRANLLEKILMLGKNEGRRRRGWQRMRWHHWLNGHEFEQTPGDGEGQGNLACCSPWGHKELDTTEWLNNNNIYIKYSEISCCCCFSLTESCPTLCDPMDCTTPGFPVLHHLPEFAQTHVHWVGDAIQLSYSMSSPSPPVFNLSQYQGLFPWVGSLHQVAKVLELQLQHWSFQWTPRTEFL